MPSPASAGTRLDVPRIDGSRFEFGPKVFEANRRAVYRARAACLESGLLKVECRRLGYEHAIAIRLRHRPGGRPDWPRSAWFYRAMGQVDREPTEKP